MEKIGVEKTFQRWQVTQNQGTINISYAKV